jgi:hypothetical protein
MYNSRIAALEYKHVELEREIIKLSKNPNFDEVKMSELKKQKLAVKDEIARLHRLQWDIDHNEIGYSDDR